MPELDQEDFWYRVECGNCGEFSKVVRNKPGASWQELVDEVFLPTVGDGHPFIHCEWCRHYAPAEIVGFCPEPGHKWEHSQPLRK